MYNKTLLLRPVCVHLVRVFVGTWVWDIIGDLFGFHLCTILGMKHSFVKYVGVAPMFSFFVSCFSVSNGQGLKAPPGDRSCNDSLLCFVSLRVDLPTVGMV